VVRVHVSKKNVSSILNIILKRPDTIWALFYWPNCTN
jgi:hypothetical protein